MFLLSSFVAVVYDTEHSYIQKILLCIWFQMNKLLLHATLGGKSTFYAMSWWVKERLIYHRTVAQLSNNHHHHHHSAGRPATPECWRNCLKSIIGTYTVAIQTDSSMIRHVHRSVDLDNYFIRHVHRSVDLDNYFKTSFAMVGKKDNLWFLKT